jgi:hypothetical protein
MEHSKIAPRKRRLRPSVLAMLAVMGVFVLPPVYLATVGSAWADNHSDGDQGGPGPAGGGEGSGGQGGEDGHDSGEDHEDGGQGQGGGGHDGEDGEGGHDSGEDHEGGGQGQGQDENAQGGQDQGGQGEGGAGRPTWAAEGIPEIELGRLNVARSPEHVLDRAYAEAMAQLPAMAGFYNLSVDQMITELSMNWDNVTIIDSPLQNLAIFRDALDGSINLSAYGITNDRNTLMAVAMGVASDKSVPVTPETVYAVSVILGMPLSQSGATAIAAQAEAIRIAVLAGHG